MPQSCLYMMLFRLQFRPLGPWRCAVLIQPRCARNCARLQRQDPRGLNCNLFRSTPSDTKPKGLCIAKPLIKALTRLVRTPRHGGPPRAAGREYTFRHPKPAESTLLGQKCTLGPFSMTKSVLSAGRLGEKGAEFRRWFERDRKRWTMLTVILLLSTPRRLS